MCRMCARIMILIAVCVGCALAQSLPPAWADDVTTQSASELGNKDPSKGETAVGSLVADAARRSARADIALIAASELKARAEPLPAGKISSADIAALIAYQDDALALLELTGKALRLALERSVAIYPQPYQGFLQVSGLKFVFDPSRPRGERVTSAMVDSAPLVDEKRYTVAVTNTMANGALGYWKVWTKDDIKAKLTDQTLVNAVKAHFKANPKIDYGKLERITIVEPRQ